MYTIRNVKESDHAILRDLAKKCPPLDVHTPYTYWVNAKYFGECSFIVESDGEPIGYIMAVDTPSVVFVWQIGILAEHHRKGLSQKLIAACVEYAVKVGKNMEVTISPDNVASYAAFAHFCQKREMPIKLLEEICVTDIEEQEFREVENRYYIMVPLPRDFE
ncbi:MAG: GNAT family N-acetyltransferase [Lachnospiraceae bacterium]|nr:GNAT family N-acetyltransferase [Lachnospiraceae bacterium]